jgi:hypothetical protein
MSDLREQPICDAAGTSTEQPSAPQLQSEPTVEDKERPFIFNTKRKAPKSSATYRKLSRMTIAQPGRAQRLVLRPVSVGFAVSRRRTARSVHQPAATGDQDDRGWFDCDDGSPVGFTGGHYRPAKPRFHSVPEDEKWAQDRPKIVQQYHQHCASIDQAASNRAQTRLSTWAMPNKRCDQCTVRMQPVIVSTGECTFKFNARYVVCR